MNDTVPVVRTRHSESKEVHRVTFAEERDEYVIDSDREDQGSNPAEAGSRTGPRHAPTGDSTTVRPSIIKQTRIIRSDVVENRDNPFVADGELRRKADYILQHSTISRARIRIADPDHVFLEESQTSTQDNYASGRSSVSPNDDKSDIEPRCSSNLTNSSNKQKQPLVGRVIPMTNQSQTSPNRVPHFEDNVNDSQNSYTDVEHPKSGQFPPQSKNSVSQKDGLSGFSPARSREHPRLKAHEHAVEKTSKNGCEGADHVITKPSESHTEKKRRSSSGNTDEVVKSPERRKTLCCSLQ